MTTLISYQDSSGVRGRCDARCYNATGPHCDCICGGLNHGVGRKQAVENTRRLAEEMIAEYAREHGLTREQVDARVNEDVYQLPLPI